MQKSLVTARGSAGKLLRLRQGLEHVKAALLPKRKFSATLTLVIVKWPLDASRSKTLLQSLKIDILHGCAYRCCSKRCLKTVSCSSGRKSHLSGTKSKQNHGSQLFDLEWKVSGILGAFDSYRRKASFARRERVSLAVAKPTRCLDSRSGLTEYILHHCR